MTSHGVDRQSGSGGWIMSHHERLRTTPTVIPTDSRCGRANTGGRQIPAMAFGMTALTVDCGGSGPWPRWPHPISPYLPLKAGSRRSQRVSRYLLVHMDGLGMLSKVVESREPASAMALERPLPRVFPEDTS